MSANLESSPAPFRAGGATPSEAGAHAAHLEGLNGPQLEAVKSLDGPVLVLAGAGSGKTRALTARLAHILHTRRAWPSEILSVTFTNKAAREMRERVAGYVGDDFRMTPWLGTFHSICARMLRSGAEQAGLKPDFTILDADDQLRIHKQLISEANIDSKQYPPRRLASIIERWKNQGWMPTDVPKKEAAAFDRKGLALYKSYQERLASLNAVDFGDLILLVVDLLARNENALAEYRNRFRFILVDEYQDTNVAQYLWLKLLAQAHGNICCVGDDDQSIYGWRGADVRNILEFEKDFKGAKVIRLEQNYRSTGHILAAASAVIAHNKGRLGKTLWTEADYGERVQLLESWDGGEEAAWIGSRIEELSVGGGRHRRCEFDEIAVLVRASRQMREIEDRLLTLGIPYRIIGGPRFYERREIRDAVAYLRLAASLSDDLAFERIVNTPKRGIGAKSLGAIHAAARAANIPLLAAARQLAVSGKLPRGAVSGLKELAEKLEAWSQLAGDPQQNPGDLAGRIVEESGLADMWRNTKTPDAETRLDNLNELASAVGGYASLRAFLDHIALVAENNEEAEGSRVSVMTLHAAKGLEFPVVFLPGWEDGGFPSIKAMEEDPQSGLEEERRLAYVGLTRAKELCLVSCAVNRMVNGSWMSSVRSRFIDELPTEHVRDITPAGTGWRAYEGGGFGGRHSGGSGYGQSAQGGYSSPGFQRLARRASIPVAELPRAPAKTSEAAYSTGERVFHKKFGYGQVVAVSDRKLLIKFDAAGPKHVLAEFVAKADGSEG